MPTYLLRHCNIVVDASARGAHMEGYIDVARVTADDLEAVFGLTNHVDHDWTENPEVQLLTAGPHRSTSVGDLVVDENGQTWICASFGWEPFDENRLPLTSPQRLLGRR